MIVCVYGRPVAPFVEPVVRDLCEAVEDLGGEMRALTLEDACRHGQPFYRVTHLYVLPFDPPLATGTPAQDLLAEIFPNAKPIVSLAAHELCWNKIATQERLLDRGLPIPETLVTALPDDVHEFVRTHEFAVLKQNYSCGGQGHLIVWHDGDQLVGDCGSHRYTINLVNGGQRRLRGEELTYPAPFYLQRLIADIAPNGVTPPQVLRAYVVDREITFWTERFRDRYNRPSDWIINHALGARYRFVQNVSDEAQKTALRAADAVGARVAAVDLVRTARGGTYVLEVDCDGVHAFVDRSFKQVPDYRDFFDFDRYIAQLIVNETTVTTPTT
jgi:glutathione synthase/RimK-type ligase-like ATP-grasp enzyme